ncbi:uncharacterized protein EI90DRAFT_638911 [Cantharellus anzutake]|uniref:uncharacterized protein n=1 Tax=Cantharellus anzutake TaxID=1750568 RepID=UPI001904640A|nr:uncharacterized protein EI90DRAFT_638911 [Cantharellus anzutake]KAF8333197.1 hypothetical protein EI90DRAFT_638911 [Cantharellus anzutake]
MGQLQARSLESLLFCNANQHTPRNIHSGVTSFCHPSSRLSWYSFVCYILVLLLSHFMVAQPLMAKGILPPPPQHASPQLYGTIVLGQWKDASLFAWHGYGNAAFGYDELLPTSNGSIQNFNGWGVILHEYYASHAPQKL